MLTEFYFQILQFILEQKITITIGKTLNSDRVRIKSVLSQNQQQSSSFSTHLSHSRQWFNTLIQRSRTAGSVAYTVFVWSRLSAPVELSTRYTTPDTTEEIGNTSATVE